MSDIEDKRPAIEDMFRKAAAAHTDIVFSRLDLRRYRGTSHVSAIATFNGAYDHNVVIDISEEIGDIVAGPSIGWPWAERIAVDKTLRGFTLLVDFDTVARPC